MIRRLLFITVLGMLATGCAVESTRDPQESGEVTPRTSTQATAPDANGRTAADRPSTTGVQRTPASVTVDATGLRDGRSEGRSAPIVPGNTRPAGDADGRSD